MEANLNQKQQIMWVLTETARQLVYPVKWLVLQYREWRRLVELERQLDAALTDPTLLDRMTKPPVKVDVRFLDEAVGVEVRHVLKQVAFKSIDGILTRRTGVTLGL